MNAATAPDYASKDEAAEEVALQAALKQIRLEEAAKSPNTFGEFLITAAVGVGGMIFFREQVINHLWIVVLAILINIRRHFLMVHRRIDAIQELEKQKNSNPSKQI